MAVIISINHETGDLSQYTTTVTDSGDLSVASGAALAGTGYGLSLLLDDTTVLYARAQITADASGVWSIRFYLDPNGLTMADGNRFTICYVENLVGTANATANVEMHYTTAGGYDLRASLIDDVPTTYTTSYYAITDAPHYVEIKLTRATSDISGDGSLEFRIDGVLKETISGKDNYDRAANLYRAHMSAVGVDAGTTGTFYMDELVVNDDGSEIGPALNHYTLTAAVGSFTLSGMDVGMLRGYILTPDVGAYSLAGVDVAFPRTYVLSPAIGSYALTGVDAILSYMGVSNAIGRVSAHTISPYGIVTSNMAVSNLSESESVNSVVSSEV